jgi:hypothetical protein
MSRESKLEFMAITLVSLGFMLWGRAFIWSSSFMAIDGQRSFSLFDDAMISMRYAWNLSHGIGLVWNTGVLVQGYTNLLMTLIMSAATLIFSKPIAVLSIQIMGVLFMLLIGWLAMQISDYILTTSHGGLRSFLRILAFISGLAYYPLAYWSLMGMETGLETVLILSGVLSALRYSRCPKWTTLLASATSFGLAFLTRNESVIFFILVWIYLGWAVKDLKELNRRSSYLQMLGSAGIVFLLAFAEFMFQYLYYGSILPNTYTLKLTGMPLEIRIQNGIAFILPFLRETCLILTPAILGLVRRLNPRKMLLASIFLGALAYQIFIGGDAWNYWRMLAPAIPLVLILSIEGLTLVAELRTRARRSTELASPTAKNSDQVFTAWSVTLFWLAAVTVANLHFFEELTFIVPPYQAEMNKIHVDTAIALSELLQPDATVGVFWAGVVPYYTVYEAIDFLGKSDRHVASLPPDLSGSLRRGDLCSIPGHNKYDLTYSIMGLKPTYVEDFTWGNEDLSAWAQTKYVAVQYRGLTMKLLKDSPDVLWKKLDAPGHALVVHYR